MDVNHPIFITLVQTYSTIGHNFQLGDAPLACDTHIFNFQSPTPAFTLDLRGGNAHGADEYVLVVDVIKLNRIYACTIVAGCGMK